MTETKLKQSGYGNRWESDSFFGGLERTTGSALCARKESTLHHEAAFRVLAYTLNLGEPSALIICSTEQTGSTR